MVYTEVKVQEREQMIRRRKSKRRNEVHPVDKPIRHTKWSDWFLVDFAIEAFMLLVRGIFWIAGAVFRAFT